MAPLKISCQQDVKRIWSGDETFGSIRGRVLTTDSSLGWLPTCPSRSLPKLGILPLLFAFPYPARSGKGSSLDPVGKLLGTASQSQLVEKGMVSDTKKYLLSNKAPKFSYSIDRVPFPQDEFQFIHLGASLTMLESHLRVEIMGDEIGRFEEQIHVRRACAP